jgi:hypothetical protein
VRAFFALFVVVGCARQSAVPCNGVLEDGELCDDGNSSDGDGCDCATRAIPNGVQPVQPGIPVVLAEDGAWCWFQDERVIVDGERILAASISHGGDIQVSSLAETGDRTHAVIYTRLERDDHDVPSLLALPDGRIAAYFTRHDGFPHLYTLMSEPGDPTAWHTKHRTSFDYDITYTNPFVLGSKPDHLFNFIRGMETNPTLVQSTDEGRTWSDGSQLLDGGERELSGRVFDHRPYVKLASDGDRDVHLLYTDGHPIEYKRNSIYHLVYRDGALWRSDGTRVATANTSPKLAPSAGTLVYDGTVLPGGQAWTWDAAIDRDGHPTVVFSTFPDPARPFFDHVYRYARWDGERWQVYRVAHAGTGIYAAEGFYSGGIAIDPDDPRIVYFSSNVDPATGEPNGSNVFELYRAITDNGGASWTITAVTSGSLVSNLRPVVPAGHLAPTTLLWMRGSYDTYLDYHTQIVSLVGEIDATVSLPARIDTGLEVLARFDLAATVNGPATPTAPGFVAAVPGGGFALAEDRGISLKVSNITGTRVAVARDPLHVGQVVCERGGYNADDKLRVELSGLIPEAEYIVRLHAHDTAGAYIKPTLWFRGDARSLDSDHDHAAFVAGHRNVNNTVAGEGFTDVVMRADAGGTIALVGRGLDYAGDDHTAVLGGVELLAAPALTLLARFDVDAEPGVGTAEGAASLSFDDTTESAGQVTVGGITVRVMTDRIEALRRRDKATDPLLADFVFGRDQLAVDISGLEVGRLYAFTVYSTDVEYNRYAATRWRVDEPGFEPIVVHGFHMNQHRTDEGARFTFFHRANSTTLRLRGEDVITSLSTNPSLVILNGLDVSVVP